MITVRVHHWRHEDGWRNIPQILQKPGGPEKEFDVNFQGWFCWAYASDEREFERWMKKNMKGKYDCTFRFNSGDPMHTVWIKEDEDATLFKLTWM
jgi:hypothetical protein